MTAITVAPRSGIDGWIRLLLLFHDVLYRFIEIPGTGPGFDSISLIS